MEKYRKYGKYVLAPFLVLVISLTLTSCAYTDKTTDTTTHSTPTSTPTPTLVPFPLSGEWYNASTLAMYHSYLTTRQSTVITLQH
jgi:hypothetical protein